MSTNAARAPEPAVDYAAKTVDEILEAIQVEDNVLKEARKRRDRVKAIAKRYPGILRVYNAGSIAHGTAKNPLPDADCGAVLDRRQYAELGPDGDGVGPCQLVDQIAAFVMEDIRDEYPDATCEITKRAIQITFHEPIDDEDPSVDLIVALTRSGADGLWIPNTETDDWDASDPEKHTELLTAEPADIRVHRARLIRLAKVAVEQDGDDKVVISFNLEAQALLQVWKVQGLPEGLGDLFRAAGDDIESRLTPDPADVSPPIKLPEGVTQAQAGKRLRFFGDRIAEAIENRYDEERVLEALVDVFPEQLQQAPRSEKSRFARSLRSGNINPGVQATLGAGSERLKNTRSFGDHAQA